MILFRIGIKNGLCRLCCFVIFCASHSVLADTITVWGEYHPPLNGEPGEENPGFMIEIAKSIFEKNGHTIDYILGPRTRGVHMVKSGVVDCVVNAKIMDHHFLSFPEQPWGYHAATLFALPESTFQYRNMAQLEKINLGAIAGMRYDNGLMDDYLEQKTDNVSFSYGNDAMKKQIKMLIGKRTDAIVSCPLLMRGQLESMGLSTETIKIVGEIKPFVGMYFACGRGYERTEGFISAINAAIPQMRKSGELQSILDKYGQIDWIEIYQSLGSPH